MRHQCLFLATLALGLVPALAQSGDSSTTTTTNTCTDLITNGGFESGTTSSWLMAVVGSGSGAVEDASSAAEGSYYLEVISSLEDGYTGFLIENYVYDVIQGDQYTISFDYKYSLNGGEDCSLLARFDQSISAPTFFELSSITSDVTEWTTVSQTITLQGSYILASFTGTCSSGYPTFNLDAVSITNEEDECTTSSITVATTTTTSLSVSSSLSIPVYTSIPRGGAILSSSSNVPSSTPITVSSSSAGVHSSVPLVKQEAIRSCSYLDWSGDYLKLSSTPNINSSDAELEFTLYRTNFDRSSSQYKPISRLARLNSTLDKFKLRHSTYLNPASYQLELRRGSQAYYSWGYIFQLIYHCKGVDLCFIWASYCSRTATITACPSSGINCPASQRITYVTTDTVGVNEETATTTPQGAVGPGSSDQVTTETILTTRVSTILQCPTTVTDCPLTQQTPHTTTETLVAGTTVYPVTVTGSTVSPIGASSASTGAAVISPVGSLTTETIYATSVSTIWECPASVTDCPLRSKTAYVATTTAAIGSTVYPVGNSALPSSTVQPVSSSIPTSSATSDSVIGDWVSSSSKSSPGAALTPSSSGNESDSATTGQDKVLPGSGSVTSSMTNSGSSSGSGSNFDASATSSGSSSQSLSTAISGELSNTGVETVVSNTYTSPGVANPVTTTEATRLDITISHSHSTLISSASSLQSAPSVLYSPSSTVPTVTTVASGTRAPISSSVVEASSLLASSTLSSGGAIYTGAAISQTRTFSVGLSMICGLIAVLQIAF
ncbi:hypothetical protein N7466_006323 [Penicillium verhagenii]|uniref:uncharacterized protein n=1 Tax=Penicillium verhagenii TaxID=1562060 RepID=UPI00254568C6|nr:uncharacterized protein N7466_006323 [Penicillium verhagenii]KAJ5930830.1 hypothetical protein N7466_006323 [Penicillium verhagenii]